MSNYCGSCGISIPSGQSYCSMCYGDPAYGRDGYLEAYMQEQERKHQEEKEAEAEYERMLEEQMLKEKQNG